jgi:hypothetical protein
MNKTIDMKQEMSRNSRTWLAEFHRIMIEILEDTPPLTAEDYKRLSDRIYAEVAKKIYNVSPIDIRIGPYIERLRNFWPTDTAN